MTTSITKEQLQRIIEISDEVISAVAGTNEDVHQESDEMIRLWDCLNDVVAPPEVVRELARIALTAKGAEPVYQWRERYGEGSLWEDCTKEQYDGFAKNPECEARVLYTAPPAPDLWIKCSERMPQPKEEVIAGNADTNEVACGVYHPSDTNPHFMDHYEEYYSDWLATHWMPRPAAPKWEDKK